MGSRLVAEYSPASRRDEPERVAEGTEEAEPAAGAPPLVAAGHAEGEELREMHLHHERDCSDASVI